MVNLPIKLKQKLEERARQNAKRTLVSDEYLIDFSSNDYLGFAKLGTIEEHAQTLLKRNPHSNGATGSRLLSGNHHLYQQLEQFLIDHYQVPSALVFNSGYDANLGFFSAVPQRGDIIYYDELVHASIRDGIKMGNAQSFKFRHNDIDDLKQKLEQHNSKGALEIYIVTESVFSMDGDSPNLSQLAELSSEHGIHLVVDEAHAIGIHKKGLVHKLELQGKIFAQTITFSKAIGCHGAAILGSVELTDYLVNFARSFIYTTAMPPHTIATILASYHHLDSEKGQEAIDSLQKNIAHFRSGIIANNLEHFFLPSTSATQLMVIPGNTRVKELSKQLHDHGFDVRAIVSPTVPIGNERIRFSLHTFNTFEQINNVLQLVKELYNG